MTEDTVPDTRQPEISVVITCHLRKQFLKDAIDSALCQSFPRNHYEILVIVDFEDSEIKEYCIQKGVRIIVDQREGIGAKMALGIEHSHGDIICFLNDDDMFFKDKISIIYGYFNEYSEVVYIHNNSIRINATGGIIDQRPMSSQTQIYKINDTVSPKWVLKSFKNYMMFNDSSISIRKNYFRNHISILYDIYGNQDNVLFYLSLKDKHEAFFIPQPMTYYRFHESGASYESDINKYCGLLERRLISLTNFLNYIISQGFSRNILSFTFSDIMSQFYQYKILACSSKVSEFFQNIEKSDKRTYRLLFTNTRFLIFILYIVSKIMPKIAKITLWSMVKKQ